MTKTSFAAGLAIVATIALVLVGCTPNAQTPAQTKADAYVRAHIEELSPRASTVGGHFTVTSVTWVDADTARVTYGDGHKQYRGIANVRADGNGVVTVTKIRMEMNGDSSSSVMEESSSSSSSMSAVSSSASSSVSSSSSSSVRASSSSKSSSLSSSSSSYAGRTKAAKGEFCGGIAGIVCNEGLTCQYAGTYPDAGGTCIQ